MAFLVASFGPVGGARWDALVGEFADFPPANIWTRPDPGESVRVGVVGAGGTVRSVRDFGADLAVAGVGTLNGGEHDVAGAILAAYRGGGASGLARLRGEHAFAVWDGRSRSLLV